MEKASVDGKIIIEWFIFSLLLILSSGFIRRVKYKLNGPIYGSFYDVFIAFSWTWIIVVWKIAVWRLNIKEKHHNKGLDKHEGDSIWIFCEFL